MQFLQSIHDFPQIVKLGDKTPSFGLNRFKQGLQFVPTDDEGFTLRGDKQRLEYRGRQRSHRFTILGDGSFEYDCILKREPETNVIRLRMEGADKYNFFRQPDFVQDPFLKGSFAVYKKQTLLGEGTGKLCHIHRPEIIDARGRRCWGKLGVVGDELLITIPEKWLGEAAYPVVVDPVVGTTTVGQINNLNNGNYIKYFYHDIILERFTIPSNFNSQARAFIYSNDDFYLIDVRPVLYTSNNNLPNFKLSGNEGKIVRNETTWAFNLGWQSTSFDVNNLVPSGMDVWFGFYCGDLTPCFDFGGSLVLLKQYDGIIPGTYPVENMTKDDLRLGIKVSMYFYYEPSGEDFYSFVFENVRPNGSLKVLRIVAKIYHVIDNLIVNSKIFPSREIFRKVSDLIKTQSAVIRKMFIALRLKTNSLVRSIFNKRFLNSRVEICLKSKIGESNRNEE
jgi:hypothetical protein